MSARRKKSRQPRPRLTHFEIHRGKVLRLRLAIADDAFAEVGDELGALFKKLAPSAVALSTVAPSAPGIAVVTLEPDDIVILPRHMGDDHAYHESLRQRFTELFSSLCDDSLADALEIAREERERRTEGN